MLSNLTSTFNAYNEILQQLKMILTLFCKIFIHYSRFDFEILLGRCRVRFPRKKYLKSVLTPTLAYYFLLRTKCFRCTLRLVPVINIQDVHMFSEFFSQHFFLWKPKHSCPTLMDWSFFFIPKQVLHTL